MRKGKALFAAGLVTGALLGGTVMTNVGAEGGEKTPTPDISAINDPLIAPEVDAKELFHYLVAIENVLVSLSVDTERSAIGLAEIDGRIRKIERRLVALEEQAAKPKRDR